MHEVVTIQLGQQANYIGTHYWNVQESYFTYAGEEESPVDHDISFRPGIGANGSDTYTPRNLIYDLKGAFGTLRRHNALYELEESNSNASQWQGNTASLQLPRITPSAYQDALDRGTELPSLSIDTVRFWSDYNRVFYHPRSIVQLNEYELNSSLMPFQRWETGGELFASIDREHDLLDRDLRPFLEECDQLQGIQVFTGMNDAWGGFAAKYLERIADELGKGCRWVFGIEENKRNSRERQAVHLSNYAQSLYALDASASLLVPIKNVPLPQPSYLTMDGASRWHTAALQAAAIESTTLTSRLRSSDSSRALLNDLETTLTNDGKRRLAACSLSVEEAAAAQPRTTTSGYRDPRMSNGHPSPLINGHHESNEVSSADIALFPQPAPPARRGRHGRARTHMFSRVETIRDLRQPEASDDPSNHDATDDFPGSMRRATYTSELLFPLLSSYPEIFRFAGRERKVACKAVLSTSNTISDSVRDMEAFARRIVSIDEREALCDGLAAIADEYEEGWNSDDDISEDD